jgi:hypothetical protein
MFLCVAFCPWNINVKADTVTNYETMTVENEGRFTLSVSPYSSVLPTSFSGKLKFPLHLEIPLY